MRGLGLIKNPQLKKKVLRKFNILEDVVESMSLVSRDPDNVRVIERTNPDTGFVTSITQQRCLVRVIFTSYQNGKIEDTENIWVDFPMEDDD